METQIFDDGSTLTFDDATGYAAATNATDVLVNQPSATWAPSSVNPAANTWEDVLRFGFSRVIDAKTRPVRPENAAPVMTRTPAVQFLPGALQSGGAWVWLALAAVAAVVVFGPKS